jgi:FkbM family methyltransferase
MQLISYAQNFEDIMLWRALGHLRTGFYIDVGAADPATDSVTRLFYDNGWTGINIEPCSQAYARLAAARRRDLNLNVAVGEYCGTVSFFEVSGSGLSTLDPVIATEHARAGWRIDETTVDQVTLADICRRYVREDVHFLKIDVEGAERDVLAGTDFVSFRPWVILAQATKPQSQEPTYVTWEPILLAARYQFARFDGLNRFYVADERWDHLHHHFRAPPNVFDGFMRTADLLGQVQQARAAQTAAEEQTARHARRVADVEAASASAEAASSSAVAAAVREAEMAERRAVAAEVRAEVQTARAVAAMRQATQASQRAATAQAELVSARVLVNAMRGSTSWRLTAPVRVARNLVGGHAGAALMVLGVRQERVERFKRVAGTDGIALKRSYRVAHYIIARAVARVRGNGTTNLEFEKRYRPQVTQEPAVSVSLLADPISDPLPELSEEEALVYYQLTASDLTPETTTRLNDVQIQRHLPDLSILTTCVS